MKNTFIKVKTKDLSLVFLIQPHSVTVELTENFLRSFNWLSVKTFVSQMLSIYISVFKTIFSYLPSKFQTANKIKYQPITTLNPKFSFSQQQQKQKQARHSDACL